MGRSDKLLARMRANPRDWRIPAHRPIKPVYIVDLVGFIDHVIEAGE